MIGSRHRFSHIATIGVALSLAFSGAAIATLSNPVPGDDAPVQLTPKGEIAEELAGADEGRVGPARRIDYYADRLVAGSPGLDITRAARLRGRGVSEARDLARRPGYRGSGRAGAAATWNHRGPDPVVQVTNSRKVPVATSGRVSALAFRHDGTLLLGAAQGGVWTYDTTAGVDGTWTPRTPAGASQSVGALAVAPSDDTIVYEGTGEGTMAPDGYFGDGVWRSADGGITWSHVSSRFTGESVSDLAVDPTDPSTVYAAVTTGIAGSHYVASTQHAGYGIWKSTDSGATWSLVLSFPKADRGATDVVVDPRDPATVVASFFGDGIYVSRDHGNSWRFSQQGLPDYLLDHGTHLALGITHPAGAGAPTLYTGFDYYDAGGEYHPARVFKSTDWGATWSDSSGPGSGPNSVVGYCGDQCYYDNEIKPDPNDANTVYALGQYNYDTTPPSGGIYRSVDGGATWTDLGWNMHPDFHALAFDPTDSHHIAVGNDGGVWQSTNRGGRNQSGDPLSAVDWQDLNGQVDPSTSQVVHSTGLSIAQYTSIQTVPAVDGQLWGGTQDNGTQRASINDGRWFDQSGGDGGYVEVDQSTPNQATPGAAAAYVFGEYFFISPFRYDPTEVGSTFGQEMIDGGINVNDREEFYVPMALNQGNPNELFLGTYRVYRTLNAETARAGDVHWAPISGDLTSGCPEGQSAPNGASGCFVSAIGLSDAGTGVYAGTSEGYVQVSADATVNPHPKWTRVGAGVLPPRPVDQIAVDRSNWRIAYAGFAGFDEGSPQLPGHVFATTDGGRHWRDASGNLPDVPVNNLVVDPSSSRTVYAATDVGVFITTDAGATWSQLASGLPRVAVWGLDYDASHGTLAAGTHGRGAYTLLTRGPLPALVVSRSAKPASVKPGGAIRYTIKVKNIGDQSASGVSVTAPLPAHVGRARVGQGGSLRRGVPTWSGLTVPAGGTVSLSLSATLDRRLPSNVRSIVADRLRVSSAQGVGTSGSPTTTAVVVTRRAAFAARRDLQGARPGHVVSFHEHVRHLGRAPGRYRIEVRGSWPARVLSADCSRTITSLPAADGADASSVCVEVRVPEGTRDGVRERTTLRIAPTRGSSRPSAARLVSVAATADTLVVQGSQDSDAQSLPAVSAALDARGADYAVWDLSLHPAIPESYLRAHPRVVWFTGSSYPAPMRGYEPLLGRYLHAGGRLFVSGQDVLDQAGGTTRFARRYLHVAWDGTERQNDHPTEAVHGVPGSPLTDTVGSVPLVAGVVTGSYEDRLSLVGAAQAVFTDDSGATDGLAVSTSRYRLVFLAFPFESYGDEAGRSDLMGRILSFLG